MQNNIILSIRHKHAEKIYSGEKTLEIRKAAPKSGLYPYIIYMYETKNGGAGAVTGFFKCGARLATNIFTVKEENEIGRVAFDELTEYIIREQWLSRSCLSMEELSSYASGKTIYGYVVSTPIRLPRPRPLSDFGLTRAPQSWQYIK